MERLLIRHGVVCVGNSSSRKIELGSPITTVAHDQHARGGGKVSMEEAPRAGESLTRGTHKVMHVRIATWIK